ncbi:MAG TPA: arabinan endo-1,5-alpha-L-arabinosidase [Polyangiaceae bacterium]|nr:arabinan endo-1,5-alpha-L-arabinosidase [Polyangiaceae bacterium]
MMHGRRRPLLLALFTTLLPVSCIELNSEPAGEEPLGFGGSNGGTPITAAGESGAGGTMTTTSPSLSGSGGQDPSQAGERNHGGMEQAGDSGAGNSNIGDGGVSAAGGTMSTPQGGAADGGAATLSGGASGTEGLGGESHAGAAGGLHVDFSGGGPLDPNDRCGVAEYSPDAPPLALPLGGNLDVHDPAIIAVDNQNFVFHTGPGIPIKTSSDLRTWSSAGRVFFGNPSWISALVPGASDLWAPDISHFGGVYHLYYAASTFGSNRSCIGHATRDSLGSGGWLDHGPVICSNAAGTTDDWNAIDPNVVLDEASVPWLTFGSFWSGIKAVRLDSSGVRADNSLYSLAARPTEGKAIEAPFITRRCGYYYLFVSFDYCCRGSSSTYRVLVGRATNVLGPYVDRNGRALLEGGGEAVVSGDSRWHGPGHNAMLFVGDRAYNVYHAYDTLNQGKPSLRIAQLAWDLEGWPVSGGP